MKRDEIAKNNNNNAKETYLFHGTALNNIPTITKDGLDFRVANLHGSIGTDNTVFPNLEISPKLTAVFLGAGIYFAEQSSVSLGYVPVSKNSHIRHL